MKRRVFLAALLLPFLSHAADAPAGAVLSDADLAALHAIETYLNGIRSLRARFLQTGPDGRVTTGTCWMVRPGRMRFEYDKPSPLLLVAGHGLVVFHDAELGQTSNIPIGRTPLGLLLADTISLTDGVTVTAFERPPGSYELTLVRTSASGEGTLTLLLSAEPLALVGWSVVDAQGRETRIRLTNVTMGGHFDDSLFTFIDPNFFNQGGGQ